MLLCASHPIPSPLCASRLPFSLTSEWVVTTAGAKSLVVASFVSHMRGRGIEKRKLDSPKNWGRGVPVVSEETLSFRKARRTGMLAAIIVTVTSTLVQILVDTMSSNWVSIILRLFWGG